MIEHTEHVDVDRPPGEVYAFLADPTNQVQWRREVKSMELVSGEPRSPGARYRQVMQPGRRESVGTHEIVAVDPPRKIEWRTPADEGPLQFTGYWGVEPRDSGSRVAIHAEVRPRGLWRLGEPFMKWYLRKVSRRYARDLEAALRQAPSAA